MIDVYFSHIGETPMTGITERESVQSGKVRDILNVIESRHPGFCQEILDTTRIRLNSATLMFKRIEVDNEGRFLESTHTRSISNLEETLSDEDQNLFIALFHPERVIQFLVDTLTENDQRFVYAGGSRRYGSYIAAPDQRDRSG